MGVERGKRGFGKEGLFGGELILVLNQHVYIIINVRS
jgi:hypothetical protein